MVHEYDYSSFYPEKVGIQIYHMKFNKIKNKNKNKKARGGGISYI
jgi:hypothetical protein